MPGQHLDAALLEGFGQFGADFFILQRDDPRQHFDHGDLGAVGIPHGGKLHADRAAADDDHRFGQVGLQDGFQIGDHLFAVDGHAGDRGCRGPGGDDDILCLELGLLAILIGHLHGVFGGEQRCAHVDVNVVLLHQEADPASPAGPRPAGCV